MLSSTQFHKCCFNSINNKINTSTLYGITYLVDRSIKKNASPIPLPQYQHNISMYEGEQQGMFLGMRTDCNHHSEVSILVFSKMYFRMKLQVRKRRWPHSLFISTAAIASSTSLTSPSILKVSLRSSSTPTNSWMLNLM